MGVQRMSIPYAEQGRRQDAYAMLSTTLETLCGVQVAPVEAITISSAIKGDLSRT